MSFKKLIERNNRIKALSQDKNVDYGLIKSILDLLVHQCGYEWEDSFNNIKEKIEQGFGNKELEIIKINLARTIVQADKIRRKEELEHSKRMKERRF